MMPPVYNYAPVPPGEEQHYQQPQYMQQPPQPYGYPYGFQPPPPQMQHHHPPIPGHPPHMQPPPPHMQPPHMQPTMSHMPPMQQQLHPQHMQSHVQPPPPSNVTQANSVSQNSNQAPGNEEASQPDEEEEDEEVHQKKANSLPIWGNEKTMNLNSLLLTNIQSSQYFKVKLYALKTYHEVIDEIFHQVGHLEPWERGSRKTAGQTGMCGGVRGVGAGGIVSTAYCILYKLFTLRLTRKQLTGLINHCDSPYIRGLGFMYIRYTQPPADLWSWYEPYLDDEEEVDVRAGGGQAITIGAMVRHFMTKLDWHATLFPRVPVPIQKQIEKQLSERDEEIKEAERKERLQKREQEEVMRIGNSGSKNNNGCKSENSRDNKDDRRRDEKRDDRRDEKRDDRRDDRRDREDRRDDKRDRKEDKHRREDRHRRSRDRDDRKSRRSRDRGRHDRHRSRSRSRHRDQKSDRHHRRSSRSRSRERDRKHRR